MMLRCLSGGFRVVYNHSFTSSFFLVRSVANDATLPRITVPFYLEKQIREKKRKLEQKRIAERERLIHLGEKKRRLIECKRVDFNWNVNQTVPNGKEVPLTSKGWLHRKAAGDFFTIRATESNPSCFDDEKGESAEFSEQLRRQSVLMSNLKRMHISKPTNVQALSFDAIVNGSNTLISGETGSGKTLAFLLPVCVSLFQQYGGSPSNREVPFAVVMAPSKELVRQIGRVATELLHDSPYTVSVASSWKDIMNAHGTWKCGDILCVTPGVMNRLMRQGMCGFYVGVNSNELKELDREILEDYKSMEEQIASSSNNKSAIEKGANFAEDSIVRSDIGDYSNFNQQPSVVSPDRVNIASELINSSETHVSDIGSNPERAEHLDVSQASFSFPDELTTLKNGVVPRINKDLHKVVDPLDPYVVLSGMDELPLGSVTDIQFVVLDEIDTLVDDSFAPLVTSILADLRTQGTPGSTQEGGAQVVLVGATLPHELDAVFDGVVDVNRLERIQTPFLHRIMPHVEQTFERIKFADRSERLLSLVRDDVSNGQSVVVFSNQSQAAVWVAHHLSDHGIDVAVAHGGMSVADRDKEMERFLAGKCLVLSATDLCSRGLDMTSVSHVLNFDCPHHISDYIHRVGRVGRVGNNKVCRATTLICRHPVDVGLAQTVELAARRTRRLPRVDANIARQMGANT